MTDALECLRLQPGEHVLWQGRAAVGAAWPPVLHVLGAGLLASVAVGLACLVCVSSGLAIFSVGLVGLITIVITSSKWLGPSYLLIAWVVMTVPGLANSWRALVEAHGWDGALRMASTEMGIGVILVAAPLIVLVSEALARLDIIYVITDRRVIGVLGGARPGVLWELSRLGAHDVRLERTWRSPGGHLVMGTPGAVRRLHLRDDDAARVLADVTT